MNCKPGDLAVIVRSKAGNCGRFLTVIRLATAEDLLAYGDAHPGSPIWVSDTPVRDVAGNVNPIVPDDILRPIRDQPGDESFVTEARNLLTIQRQNDKLKKVTA